MTKRRYLVFLIALSFTTLVATGARSQGDFEYMSSQPFSATAIKGVETPSDCSTKEVGQFILATNIPVEETVYTAMSNQGQTWTKRGKLYEINEELKGKIIEQFKKDGKDVAKEFGVASEEEVRAKIVSGAYFMDVPLNQNFTLWLYSQGWKNGSQDRVLFRDTAGPKVKCETDFLFWPKVDSELKESYRVCAHGTDRIQDYAPKKTFNLPEQANDLSTFRENQGVEIKVSLGPCQDGAEVVKAVESGQAPSGGAAAGRTEALETGAYNPPVGNITSLDPSSPEWRDALLAKFNEMRHQAGVTADLAIDQNLQLFAQRRLEFEKSEENSTGQSKGDPNILKADCDHDQFAEQVLQNELHIFPNSEISNGTGSPSVDRVAGLFADSSQHHGAIVDTANTKVGMASGIVNNLLCTIVDLD